MLEKGLRSNDFDVVAFSSATKALQYFESEKESIDLVMTDARMPEMTGFLFARKVKDLAPYMRIILISAFEINKGELNKVMPGTRIDGFLTKPFHVAELVEAIRSVA